MRDAAERPRSPIRRQLLWLLPGWLYFPFLLSVFVPLGRHLPENALGVAASLTGVLLIIPLVGALTGRISGKLFTWTFTVPNVLILLAMAVLFGD